MVHVFSISEQRKTSDVAYIGTREGITQAPIPCHSFHYEADLVHRLKSDHERLLSAFIALLPCLRRGELPSFRSKLRDFKMEFQGHVMRENIKFYTYLDQSFEEAYDREMLRDFRREMFGINRTVVSFCNRFLDERTSRIACARFNGEAENIAHLLLRHVEREEHDLFPLYHCHNQRVIGEP